MKTINLDKRFTAEVNAVKGMKERGVLEDYRHNATAGIVWIKAEGEWIEVFSIDDVLFHETAHNGY